MLKVPFGHWTYIIRVTESWFICYSLRILHSLNVPKKSCCKTSVNKGTCDKNVEAVFLPVLCQSELQTPS